MSRTALVMVLLSMLACSQGPKGPPPPGVRPRGPAAVPTGPDGKPLNFNLVVPTTNAASGGTARTAASTGVGAPLTLPHGRLAGAGEEAPGNFRVLGASSKDGLTFTPTGLIVDQANVPDLVVDTKGTLYLYYTAAYVNGRKDGLAVAISSDRGQSWTHRAVAVDGDARTPTDPDVVILSDGSFRLYYTSATAKHPDIAYAESPDGVRFTAKGLAFAPNGGAMDPNTWVVGTTWHMLTLDGEGRPSLHATSKDGRSFQPAAAIRLKGDDTASNAASTGSGIRMFTFAKEDITSYFARDGVSYSKEAGSRISLNRASSLGASFLKDAAAARLPDGSWFAAYVTKYR